MERRRTTQRKASCKWRAKNPNYFRKRYHERKLKIFELLGNKCICCGFSDKQALQIDHIHGKGTRRLRMKGMDKYKRILLEIQEGSNDYQLLCANCNQIKKHKNKEY